MSSMFIYRIYWYLSIYKNRHAVDLTVNMLCIRAFRSVYIYILISTCCLRKRQLSGVSRAIASRFQLRPGACDPSFMTSS